MNQGKLGIKSRLGVVASLAMVALSGAACSMETQAPSAGQTGEISQFISTPLITSGAVKYDTTGGKNEVDIIMAGETAEVYVNPADSSLMVNGQQAKEASTGKIAYGAGSKANITTIKVTDSQTAKADILILNYINGVFGLGTVSGSTYTAGTQVTLAGGSTVNTLIVKGGATADSWAAGPSGISLTNAAKAPTRDITATHVQAYNFFLGDGNDTFTSAGASAVTGGVWSSSPPTVAVFGGNGDDILNEGSAATPNETFSGGPGNDTVDYSARTNPVLVIVDATGVGKSGESMTAVTKCPTYTAADAMAMTPASYSAVADEADVILDADIIKAGKASAGSNPLNVVLGDKSGKLTVTGGPGNDLFCEGDDNWKNGTDVLTGGGGVDAVDYSLRTHTLSVTMDGKTASGDSTGNSSKGEADLVGLDVQNIYLGSGGSSTTPSVYTGNLLNNTFFSGTGGYATINGSDGDDTLNEGTDPTSALTGLNPCDTMMTNPVCPDNTTASETFNGGKGTDTVDYHNRVAAAIYVKMDGAFKGGAGASSAGNDGTEKDVIGLDVENVYGGAGADHIEGNLLDNDIEGNGGGDTLCGGAGNDTLIGNNASTTDAETLHGGDCADSADSGAFNMCLSTGASGTPLVANAQNCQFVSQ